MPETSEVSVTSENEVPVIDCSKHFVEKLRGYDFNFSALEFPDWQDLFKDCKPGDKVRVRVTVIRSAQQ